MLRLSWNKSLHTSNTTALQGQSTLDLTQSTVHATSETYRRQVTTSTTQGREHVEGVKKEGQRPSPSPHTHQPGKEPKQMTPGDLTCPQVNILGYHERQVDRQCQPAPQLSFCQHVCMNLTAGNSSQHNRGGGIPHCVVGH